MASCRFYKTQMDWGNPGVICAGNKNLWVPHEEDKRWKHFIGGKKLSLLCHSFIQSIEDSFTKENARPVNTCCWRWHSVPTVTAAVISVCCRFAPLQSGMGPPRPQSLQHDESSGIKMGDGINSVYKGCYLAPTELIPSFSYFSCQMNKIFRNIYIGDWGMDFHKDPRKIQPQQWTTYLHCTSGQCIIHFY